GEINSPFPLVRVSDTAIGQAKHDNLVFPHGGITDDLAWIYTEYTRGEDIGEGPSGALSGNASLVISPSKKIRVTVMFLDVAGLYYTLYIYERPYNAPDPTEMLVRKIEVTQPEIQFEHTATLDIVRMRIQNHHATDDLQGGAKFVGVIE
ncbi:MAG: hypothetical protein COY40_01790, partial [Alphaproteobacteria bacterium CG_4_10_14_0_8_um_filter_53_9]